MEQGRDAQKASRPLWQMKIKMRALREFAYADKVLKAGDVFDADTDTEANVLEHVGHASRDVEEQKRSYRRRDLRAEH